MELIKLNVLFKGIICFYFIFGTGFGEEGETTVSSTEGSTETLESIIPTTEISESPGTTTEETITAFETTIVSQTTEEVTTNETTIDETITAFETTIVSQTIEEVTTNETTIDETITAFEITIISQTTEEDTTHEIPTVSTSGETISEDSSVGDVTLETVTEDFIPPKDSDSDTWTVLGIFLVLLFGGALAVTLYYCLVYKPSHPRIPKYPMAPPAVRYDNNTYDNNVSTGYDQPKLEFDSIGMGYQQNPK